MTRRHATMPAQQHAYSRLESDAEVRARLCAAFLWTRGYPDDTGAQLDIALEARRLQPRKITWVTA